MSRTKSEAVRGRRRTYLAVVCRRWVCRRTDLARLADALVRIVGEDARHADGLGARRHGTAADAAAAAHRLVAVVCRSPCRRPLPRHVLAAAALSTEIRPALPASTGMPLVERDISHLV